MLLIAGVTLWILVLVVWTLLKLRQPRLEGPKPPMSGRHGHRSRRARHDAD